MTTIPSAEPCARLTPEELVEFDRRVRENIAAGLGNITVPCRVMQRFLEDVAMLRQQPARDAAIRAEPAAEERSLFLWKNFHDGKSEYWAFDNLYPCYPGGDPMVLGEPCGYVLIKVSVDGRARAPAPPVVARGDGEEG